ncbi:MAG: T9SS type A sorting domain-containing protein [Saprospiraceae bacterium]|nr:T9SS type A sorting domain-containing protein [Saprospiraceae bacterium]
MSSCKTTSTNNLKIIKDKIKIYPNPCSNYFSMETPHESDLTNVVITLYDMYGRVVLAFRSRSAEAQDVPLWLMVFIS